MARAKPSIIWALVRFALNQAQNFWRRKSSLSLQSMSSGPTPVQVAATGRKRSVALQAISGLLLRIAPRLPITGVSYCFDQRLHRDAPDATVLATNRVISTRRLRARSAGVVLGAIGSASARPSALIRSDGCAAVASCCATELARS